MGRSIWVISKGREVPKNDGTDGVWHEPASTHGPFRVLSFKKFLPRGPIFADDVIVGERQRSLVQVYTDPGGVRTLAVAEVHLKDPRRAREKE